jgi:carboxyl-terminal processing protease
MQENKDTEERRVETATPLVRKSFLGAGLACLLAVSAFFSGVHVGSASLANTSMEAGLFSFWSSKPKVADTVDLTEFWKVWNLLDEKFVSSSSTKKVSDKEKLEGAIAGLVSSYDDPYTVFLKPTDASSFQDEISGNFGGVGMEVGQRDNLITVIAPLPGTPAEASGIVAKDVIVKIDGKVTEGMSIEEAVSLIRGEVGTKVKLSIYRAGEAGMLEKEVTRAKIDIPTVATEKKGDVFVISLYSFNAVAEQKMNEALDEFVKSGSHKLILDVRGNPGGFLQSAVAITSRFVEGGKVIVSENFGTEKQGEVYRSSGKTLGAFMPKEMIVLIDGGSASASEILAGALQEHGVAKLLGAQSYGKGSVQELVDLDSGSSLKVTIARWFTPNGVSISLAGLTPDIVVPRTPQQVIDKVDPQMEAALKWLGGDHTMPKVGTTTPKI